MLVSDLNLAVGAKFLRFLQNLRCIKLSGDLTG